MPTRIQRVLLLTAAAAHLGLVTAGGLDICPWEWGAIGRPLAVYGALSGAGSGYSFYAPSVRSAPDATFTVVDREGRRIVDKLQTGVTREADLRVQDLIDVMNHRRTDDAVRRRIAASWAAAMFARHPAAESVTVDVGHGRVPTMAALRGGAEPRWRSKFRARIVRAPAIEE